MRDGRHIRLFRLRLACDHPGSILEVGSPGIPSKEIQERVFRGETKDGQPNCFVRGDLGWYCNKKAVFALRAVTVMSPGHRLTG